MKIYLLFTFFLVSHISSSFAQEISELRVVGKAVYESGELIDQSIRDVNGEIASGIIVLTDLTSLAFEARNGVVKVNSSPGKYVVFVSPTERVLTVLSSGYKPLTIYLYDVGIRLKPGQVWKLEVTGSKKMNQIPINIKVTPEAKSILLDGNQVDPSQAIMAEVGSHQVRIEQLGYKTVLDSITVSPQKTLFEFNLKQVKPEKLVIRTTPKDASVIIDNKLVGLTPFTDFYYPGIVYQLKIVKNGYRDIDQSIELEIDKPLDLSFNMVKNVGNLMFNVTPADAQILINKKVFTGQKQIELSSGTYLVEISKDGYESISETFQLKEYEKVDKVYNLKRLSGSLRFRINDPDADVELYDNSILYKKWKGIEYLVGIPAGTYKVIAKKPGYVNLESYVIIKENVENQFNLEFTDDQIQTLTQKRNDDSKKMEIERLEQESKDRLERERISRLEAEKKELESKPIPPTTKPKTRWYSFSDYSSWNFSYTRPEFSYQGFKDNISDSHGFAIGLDANGGFFSLNQQAGLTYHTAIDGLEYEGERIQGYMHAHYQLSLGAGISLFILSPYVSVGIDYNYIETQWDGLETSSVDFINGVINYGVKLRFPNSSVGFHFNYSESFNIEDNYSDLPAFIPVKRLSGGLSFYF